MRSKKIYALYSKGVLMDRGSSRELAEELGTSKELVSNYARDGLTYKGQYTFREIGFANIRAAWAKEWADITEKLLTAGR